MCEILTGQAKIVGFRRANFSIQQIAKKLGNGRPHTVTRIFFRLRQNYGKNNQKPTKERQNSLIRNAAPLLC